MVNDLSCLLTLHFCCLLLLLSFHRGTKYTSPVGDMQLSCVQGLITVWAQILFVSCCLMGMGRIDRHSTGLPMGDLDDQWRSQKRVLSLIASPWNNMHATFGFIGHPNYTLWNQCLVSIILISLRMNPRELRGTVVGAKNPPRGQKEGQKSNKAKRYRKGKRNTVGLTPPHLFQGQQVCLASRSSLGSLALPPNQICLGSFSGQVGILKGLWN